MYQFFCIVEEEENRAARRVPIEGDLQRSVSEELDTQAEHLVPEDAEIIPYEPGYTPDIEVFRLAGYPLPDYVEAALTTPDTLPVLDDEELSEGRVKSLFGVELAAGTDSRNVVFQNFNAGQVLRRGFLYLFLDRDTFQKSDRTGLKVGNKVSAVLRDGDLLFQSEHLVRRYLELDPFFRDATDEEITELLSHSALAPTDREEFIDTADRWIRRKTTSIRERGILDAVPVSKIVETGRDFDLEVEVRQVDGENRIVIPTDKKEIKRLLRLLDDDLLESGLTDARYQVSSKRKI
jgi:hypothetical protein